MHCVHAVRVSELSMSNDLHEQPTTYFQVTCLKIIVSLNYFHPQPKWTSVNYFLLKRLLIDAFQLMCVMVEFSAKSFEMELLSINLNTMCVTDGRFKLWK